MPSHLCELQSCKSIISTNFPLIFIFKYCTTQFSYWIVSWNEFILIFVYGYLVKLTCSFVAIELFASFKNVKFPFLLLKKALGIWALKVYYLRKNIDFFAFCAYKKVWQKNFLYINVKNDDSHQRKTTCTFSYTVRMKSLTIK